MFVVGNVTFDVFGDSSLAMEQYHTVLAEARSFILACYRMSNCTSLNEARVQMWAEQDETEHSWATQTVCSSPDWGSVSTECSASTSCSCCLEGLCERTCPIPDTSRTWVVPSRGQTISPSCCSPCKHTPGSCWATQGLEMWLLQQHAMQHAEVYLQSKRTWLHPFLPVQRGGRLPQQMNNLHNHDHVYMDLYSNLMKCESYANCNMLEIVRF